MTNPIKKLTRGFISNAVALIITSYLITGFEVKQNFETIALGAAILMLVTFFVKPLVKAISFPINLITLGFFELLINTLLLYLVIFLVSGIEANRGTLNFGYLGFIISEIKLSSFGTIFASSLSISIINWLIKILLF